MYPPADLPSIEVIKQHLRYDPATGEFFSKRGFHEVPVLRAPSHRYLRVNVAGKIYYGHRIAWKLSHACDPVDFIDHIDGDKSNNRIDNLRLANASQNQANRCEKTVLPKGVFFDANSNRYRARIRVAGRRHLLGSFATADLAAEAYRSAAITAFGEYARFTPVEADASRRDALRVVNENLRAAERFALTGASLSPDAAIAAIEAGLAMVRQPVQQQQGRARETAAEWGARMLAKHPTPAPCPVREDSPAMTAALATAADAGRRYAEAQNAVRAELDIAAAPARAGRYGKAA